MSTATASVERKLTRQQLRDREMYGLAVSDPVVHVSDSSGTGSVRQIDRNLTSPTTCQVHWDDEPAGVTDTVWTNKLEVRDDV